MSAFDESRPASLLHDASHRLARRFDAVDGDTRKMLRLHEVWRQQRREREQFLLYGFDGVLLDEPASACGNHHRVEHHVFRTPVAEPVGNCLHDAPRVEHPDFHRVGAQVGKHGVNLPRHHVGVDALHAVDAESVLRRHRRDSRSRINADSRHCLNVSLYARSARRVGACDCQNYWIFSHTHSFFA